MGLRSFIQSSSYENCGLQIVAVHLGIAKPQIVVSTLAIIPPYICYERTDCRASSPYLIVAIASDVDSRVKAYQSCPVPLSRTPNIPHLSVSTTGLPHTCTQAA